MMTRAEHLGWCKKRALEYIDAGDVNNGLTSMFSDLSGHPETANHAGITLGGMLMLGGHLRNQRDACDFIEGFN